MCCPFPAPTQTSSQQPHPPGIVLGMGSANERRYYIVTPPLIGWAHTQNDPSWHYPAHPCTVYITGNNQWSGLLCYFNSLIPGGCVFNTLNPVSCVAIVCHQVCCMYWRHLGLIHKGISLGYEETWVFVMFSWQCHQGKYTCFIPF